MRGGLAVLGVLLAMTIAILACSSFSSDPAPPSADDAPARADGAAEDGKAAARDASDVLDCAGNHILCDDFEDIDASTSRWLVQAYKDAAIGFSNEHPFRGSSGIAAHVPGGPGERAAILSTAVTGGASRVHCQFFVSSQPVTSDAIRLIWLVFRLESATYAVTLGPVGTMSRFEQVETTTGPLYASTSAPGYPTATWTKIELDIDVADKLIARIGGGQDVVMDSGLPATSTLAEVHIGADRNGDVASDLSVFIDDIVCDAR